MNYTLKWFLVLPVLGTLVFFVFQSDKKQLQKKTHKLITVLSSGNRVSTPLALIRRAQRGAKYVHFSVQYEVRVGGYSYRNRSLANLKSDLLAYFKQKPEYSSHLPLKKDIVVSLSKDGLSAKTSFSLRVRYKNKEWVCDNVLQWKKEKSWLIHKAHSDCVLYKGN